VRKRDGRPVPYDRAKIADAIFRAAEAVGGEDRFLAEQLAGMVEAWLEKRGPAVPTIEDVQDTVEKVLIEAGHAKTAKAYILYRERVPAAREAPACLIGGSLGQEAGPFPPPGRGPGAGRPAPEAEEVARAVEARLLASRLRRVGAGLVAALVRAEMFARGYDSKVGRTDRVGVERSRVREALSTFVGERLAGSPAEATQALGELVVAEHLLSDAIPAAAAEAHRCGDLHLYDLGLPLALTAVTLPAARVLERHLWGEGASRPFGFRRAAAALRRAVSVSAPFAARTLALEDVNVLLAPFAGPLSDDALREELRELLLSPELAAFPARGGLLSLELGLAAEVPLRLRARSVPPPAPPGLTYGDLGDEALRLARFLVREHLALRREGRLAGPELTLVLPRGAAREPALRALVREALGSAAEVGEPLVVFEHAGSPSRGCRWLRLEEGESPDPLRFDVGDVTVASAVAVNLVSAACLARGSRQEALAGVERLALLAVEATRRLSLGGPAAEPGGALWALARGEHPLVDLAGAWHVLEPVGVEQAARVLLPEAPLEERLLLQAQLLARLEEAAAGEAQRRELSLVLVAAPVPRGPALRAPGRPTSAGGGGLVGRGRPAQLPAERAGGAGGAARAGLGARLARHGLEAARAPPGGRRPPAPARGPAALPGGSRTRPRGGGVRGRSLAAAAPGGRRAAALGRHGEPLEPRAVLRRRACRRHLGPCHARILRDARLCRASILPDAHPPRVGSSLCRPGEPAMKIRRLEIQGFKSFADRTAFDFGAGISVVGPNGCGKSNVVDAIKWVLGDMSPKSLRGKRMEDVIFAGSRTRKPSGLAEVTLVLDNEDGLLKTEHTEVSVTRRLNRAGESDYLVGGQPARLKDIRELFLDTGLGIDGNAIMEQGRIDALLLADANDRRSIFEEAAGVSRYKQRRKEAEQKLVRTHENLERLRTCSTSRRSAGARSRSRRGARAVTRSCARSSRRTACCAPSRATAASPSSASRCRPRSARSSARSPPPPPTWPPWRPRARAPTASATPPARRSLGWRP
jgi:chromosome segregation protein